MRTYHSIADSVFNVEKERSYNSPRLRYENQKRENAIQERDLRLLKGRKRLQLMVSSRYSCWSRPARFSCSTAAKR
ncbi:MAG: hypothetical protein ACLS37_12165 [Alistipes sp.]